MDLNVTAVDVVDAELKKIQQQLLHKHPNYYVLSYVHKYDDAFVDLGRIGAEDLTHVLYDDVSDDGDYTMMGFGSKLLPDPLLYLQQHLDC